MTISEALISLNSFPIPVNAIDKICIDRALNSAGDYLLATGQSQSYILATADVYYWLHGHPNIVEQEVGVNQAIAIKQDFLKIANSIYAEYGDPKFIGVDYGFVGENYNG